MIQFAEGGRGSVFNIRARPWTFADDLRNPQRYIRDNERTANVDIIISERRGSRY